MKNLSSLKAFKLFSKYLDLINNFTSVHIVLTFYAQILCVFITKYSEDSSFIGLIFFSF